MCHGNDDSQTSLNLRTFQRRRKNSQTHSANHPYIALSRKSPPPPPPTAFGLGVFTQNISFPPNQIYEGQIFYRAALLLFLCVVYVLYIKYCNTDTFPSRLSAQISFYVCMVPKCRHRHWSTNFGWLIFVCADSFGLDESQLASPTLMRYSILFTHSANSEQHHCRVVRLL